MTEAAPPGVPDRRARIALTAVLVVVFLVFLRAAWGGFTTWDDPEFCAANPDVASPNLAVIFDPHHWVVGDWTPMATLTYAAERALFGAEPWAPHLTNVLLHVLGVWLVFRLMRDVGFGAWESLAVALVFGIHPLQVESVAWVAARKNVLVAVFSLAFLRSYLGGRHALATIWFALAICSKATSVGLPLVAAAAQALGVGVPRAKTTWVWIGGWSALAVMRALVSLKAQAVIVAKIAAFGFAGRMAYMGSVLTTQARQVVAPTDLSVVYDPPRREWSDATLLGQWALVASIVVVCIVVARRDRRLAFVGVFALAMMAPTLNVFPGPCLQADRYVHLPLIGIGAFLVAALRPLARWRSWAPGALLVAWTAAVLVPSTWNRIGVWRTDESLWNATCLAAPSSGASWSHLGRALADRGAYGDALAAFRRARELDATDDLAAFNVALCLHALGDDEASAKETDALLARSPADGEAHALRGRLHQRAGRLADAQREFAKALELAPDSPLVRAWAAEVQR